MADHDPMCPTREPRETHDDGYQPVDLSGCQCNLIAQVRADERENMDAYFASRSAEWEAKARADERARQAAVSAPVDEFLIDNVRRIICTDLRAQVQPLYDEAYRTSAWNDLDVGQLTAYRKVLALFDGGSDE